MIAFAKLTKPPDWQAQGFVLVMVLLLLGILSLSAYLAMERSHFSLKINSNRLLHIQAKQHAEDGRREALTVLQAMLRDQVRSSGISSGTQVHLNKSQLSLPTAPINGRLQPDSLQPFLSIRSTARQADVYIQALPSQFNTQGVSLVQHRAYQGAGQGAGTAGTIQKFYEIRAKGIVDAAGAELTYWSAADYRFVP